MATARRGRGRWGQDAPGSGCGWRWWSGKYRRVVQRYRGLPVGPVRQCQHADDHDDLKKPWLTYTPVSRGAHRLIICPPPLGRVGLRLSGAARLM